MPYTYGKEFQPYLERFERLVGAIQTGQYGRFRGRLVRKLSPDEFDEKMSRYMNLGARFSEMVVAGDTIDDTIMADLRVAEVELIVEESLFLLNFRD
ncbi:hypothetical protein KKF91_18225 [Myxococcota bacterium]|nr:hypothetical protein [Myxococcota bacterium]MBU1432480.1 hypothetical protein [Myxococcota bacterium]MBU1900734.1 hypothetical protein [Myxococcota bacterium]